LVGLADWLAAPVWLAGWLWWRVQVAVIFSALLGTPLWLFLARTVGKRNTWLLWSLTLAITNLLFALIGKGDVTLFIIFAGINGVPVGAKFLADAILADVIDYDEFLTGARSEATYTMFKSFLPKIAAIPASAVPVALLGYFGHISPVDGVVQKQTDPRLVPYLYVTFVIIPTTLSLAAFALKTRFPLKASVQNEKVVEGIAKHLIKVPSMCPISGVPYRVYAMTEAEQIESYKLDNFMGADVIEGLHDRPEQTIAALKRRMKLQFAGGVGLLAVSVLLLARTYRFLSPDSVEEEELFPLSFDTCETDGWAPVRALLTFVGGPPGNWTGDDDGLANQTNFSGNGTAGGEPKTVTDLSFLPVFGMVMLGMSATILQWSYLRLRAIYDLAEQLPPLDLLKKVLKQRRLKDKCGDFKPTMCGGCRESEVMIPKQRRLSTFRGGYDVYDADYADPAKKAKIARNLRVFSNYAEQYLLDKIRQSAAKKLGSAWKRQAQQRLVLRRSDPEQPASHAHPHPPEEGAGASEVQPRGGLALKGVTFASAGDEAVATGEGGNAPSQQQPSAGILTWRQADQSSHSQGGCVAHLNHPRVDTVCSCVYTMPVTAYAFEHCGRSDVCGCARMVRLRQVSMHTYCEALGVSCGCKL
jgi:hypothetical protein